jgi:hypothetical protein
VISLGHTLLLCNRFGVEFMLCLLFAPNGNCLVLAIVSSIYIKYDTPCRALEKDLQAKKRPILFSTFRDVYSCNQIG